MSVRRVLPDARSSSLPTSPEFFVPDPDARMVDVVGHG